MARDMRTNARRLSTALVLFAACLAATAVRAASLGGDLQDLSDAFTTLRGKAAEARLRAAHAEEELNDILQVVRDASGRLILKADCRDLPGMLGALADWKARFGETPGAAPVIAQDGAACSATIDAVAPAMVLRLHGTKTRHSGPNCWNTALLSARVALFQRASEAEEIRFWTHSPLCRELSPEEPRLPGDIISVSGPGDSPELHAFVYITDKLAFAKNGFDVQFPYELQALERQYQLAALGDEVAPAACRRAVGRPADCNVWANHYRCVPYAGYVSRAQVPDKDVFLKTDLELTAIEKRLSPLVVSGVWTKDIRLELEFGLRPLEALARAMTAAHPEDALWKSLLFRIGSFRTQFDVLDDELKETKGLARLGGI